MKVTGIVAEYNPFHRGHKYQIDYCKEELHSDYVIVVMSGDYVQRGTPALLPKHLRTEMALHCGADLVLEMPVSVSTASAEAFAMGAVSVLDALQVADILCFGSECGEVSALQEFADVLVSEPKEYRLLLKKFLSEGFSFPAARSQALIGYFNNPHNIVGDTFDGILSPHLNQITQILNSPNNILGIEYCKALNRLKSGIKPVTLKRQGMGYHETLTNDFSAHEISADLPAVPFASASAIRGLLNSGPTQETIALISAQVPDEASALMENACRSGSYMTEDDLNTLLIYRILYEDPTSLAEYMDVSPDLADRIINCRNEISGFSQAASLLKTKELTQTRIQRALLHSILQIRDVPSQIPYARVLGFRKECSPLLKEIKKRSSVPLITKLADADALLDKAGQRLLEETTKASNLYEKLLCKKSGQKFIHEYQKQLIIL